MNTEQNQTRLPVHPGEAIAAIEVELAKFEKEERLRLGLSTEKKQWEDKVNRAFYADQRAHTTILVSGLTMAHDHFVQAGLNRFRVAEIPEKPGKKY